MFVDKFSEDCLPVATILLADYKYLYVYSPEAVICPIQFNTPHIYTYDYAVHTATIDYW